VCIGDVLTYFNFVICGTIPFLEAIWDFLRRVLERRPHEARSIVTNTKAWAESSLARVISSLSE
jgi:hypothetical protein